MKPIVKTALDMAAVLDSDSELILQLIDGEKDIKQKYLYSGIGYSLLNMANVLRKSYNDKEPTV